MENIILTENEIRLFKILELMYHALMKSKALVPEEDLDKIKTGFEEVIKIYQPDNPKP